MKPAFAFLALVLASALAAAQPVGPETAPLSLYQQAVNAERDGKMQEAVRLYVRAAHGGEAKAASRLAVIYDKGIGGVERNYAESLKWDNAARVLGERLIGDFPRR
jgi:serine/threonine-protein kinase